MKPVQQVVLNGATDPLCKHYEQLRGYVLEASDMPGQVYGLGVMLQKGMRAWIEATCEHCQVILTPKFTSSLQRSMIGSIFSGYRVMASWCLPVRQRLFEQRF